MRRHEFDHVIGAAANVLDDDEFVVIGSQAILGAHPDPPHEMLISMEVDVYPRRDPSLAEKLDGALGDGSQFHATYGYYAHGVGPETAKAPDGWEKRLVRVEVPPRVGSAREPVAWCLEVHDLILAKCVAGRERDWDFARDAVRAGVVQMSVLEARVTDLPIEADHQRHIASMLSELFG